jgi:hypothetical protein
MEVIHDGVTMEWLADGRVVCFTIKSLARPAIDAWLDKSYQVTLAWPQDIPYLAVQDATAIALTPYIRERSAQTVAKTPRHLHGRSCVVLPKSMLTQVMRLFVMTQLSRQHHRIARGVQLDRQEALNWVLAYKPTA